MLEVLTHSILPVFAMMALGYLMGRGGAVATDEARVLNRFSFLVLQPALIFPLMIRADFSAFDAAAIGLYGLSEAITFTGAYVIARFLLGREHLESFLLAMATIFVNSLLYIWPISFLIYGEASALPITAIVAWDASVVFGAFIIAMELMTKSENGPMHRIIRNPVLIAIMLGVCVNLLGLYVPEPILTFADFAGKATAPLTLFAVGVILSQNPLRFSPTIFVISGVKLVVFPAVLWALLIMFSPNNPWQPYLIFNAAGPSGAMAFALALLYNVRTETIAQVIIWTSVLSLFSLAYLA